MTPDVVVFDFDGTLAHRPGMWTGCLHEVLTQHLPDHDITLEDLRPHLRDGFPWHRPNVGHPELADPDQWWEALGPLFDRIHTSLGIDPQHFPSLRAAVRSHYCDPAHFQLYPDTVEALEVLRHAGVRATILSNHVPELGEIVSHLGLDHLVDDVFTSARTGFEKPHPEAYRAALGRTDPSAACMIGDNPVADKQGAIDVGMRALLVRHRDADHENVLSAVNELSSSST